MTNNLLFTITPAGMVFLFLIAFSIWITVMVKKRMEMNSGCLSFGYIALLIFSISTLAIGATAILVSYIGANLYTFVKGERYTAIVTDYTSEEREDDEGDLSTYYYAQLAFVTDAGKRITVEDSSSVGEPQIGEEYTIYYNASDGKKFVWSAAFPIMTCGLLMMSSILLVAFYGIMRYALGFEMKGFWKFLQNFGSVFFIPFVMICFDLLLIYGLFHKTQPLWVYVLLSFFILVLTLAIWGYIKMTIKKGSLKWEKRSDGSWTGDWEEDGREASVIPSTNNAGIQSVKKITGKYKKEKDNSNDTIYFE